VDALATGPEKLPSADEWLQQKAAADAQAAQDGPAQTPLQQFLREKQLLRVKVGGAMRCGVLPPITPDPQRTSFVAGHDSHWRASVAGRRLTPQLAPPHAQARRQRELDKIAAKKKLLRDREEERRRQRVGGKPLRASSSSRETAAAAEEAKKKKEGLKWAPVPTASVWGTSKSAGVGRDRACVGRMICCPPRPIWFFSSTRLHARNETGAVCSTTDRPLEPLSPLLRTQGASLPPPPPRSRQREACMQARPVGAET